MKGKLLVSLHIWVSNFWKWSLNISVQTIKKEDCSPGNITVARGIKFFTSNENPIRITFTKFIENTWTCFTFNKHCFAMMIWCNIWFVRKHILWNVFNNFRIINFNIPTIWTSIHFQMLSLTFCPIVINTTILSTNYIHKISFSIIKKFIHNLFLTNNKKLI